MSAKEYSLGEVLLLATGGRICSPLHRAKVEPILDLLAFMFGRQDVHMLEVASLTRICQEPVLRHYPFLVPIVQRIEDGELSGLLASWLYNETAFREALSEWLDTQWAGPIRLHPLSELAQRPSN
jgi:hypothetical protein